MNDQPKNTTVEDTMDVIAYVSWLHCFTRTVAVVIGFLFSVFTDND